MAFEALEIFKYLKDENLTQVVLRRNDTPIFWNGPEALEGPFSRQSREDILKTILMPLDEAQIAEFRVRNFLALPLSIKDLGEFYFEAYLREGVEELCLHNGPRITPLALFREHAGLLAEHHAEPNEGDIFWNLAQEFIAQNEAHLAWRALERASQLNPDDPTVHLEIGQLLGYELRRVDEAVTEFEKGLSQPGVDPAGYFHLAAMHRALGELPDAGQVVRRGLLEFPNEASLLEALAVCLIEQNQMTEALKVIEQLENEHGADEESAELKKMARGSTS